MLKWTIGPEDRHRRHGGASPLVNNFQKQRRKLLKENLPIRKLGYFVDTPTGQVRRNGSVRVTETNNVPRNYGAISESRSLWYMSLDHLPLAIVKQYERMLAENNELENISKKPRLVPSSTEVLLEPQLPAIKEAINRPLKVKKQFLMVTRDEILLSNQIYPPKPSELTCDDEDIQADVGRNKYRRNGEAMIVPKGLLGNNMTSRPSYFPGGMKMSPSSKSRTPTTRSGPPVPLAPHLKTTCCAFLGRLFCFRLPRAEMSIEETNRSQHRLLDEALTACIFELYRCEAIWKNVAGANMENYDSLNGKTSRVVHDISDPEFLDPLQTPFHKKLSLKRRELRKLQKLRTETERLSRFLRKYYHDCLPNIPPEDEADGSPEEKTISSFLIHLVQTMELWNQNGHDLSSDSTTTTTTTSSDSTSSDSESTLPPLEHHKTKSHLPVIVEDTEHSSSEQSTITTGDPSQELNVPSFSQNLSETSNSLPPQDPIMKIEGDETLLHESFDPPPVSPNCTSHTFSNRLFTMITPSKARYRRRKIISGKAATIRTPSGGMSSAGEVLVSNYRNGNYVTLHVIEARNLQPSITGPWNLSFKVSFLPDGEEKVRASNPVKVDKNRSRVRIEQKFSFESGGGNEKIFLTFWSKRLNLFTTTGNKKDHSSHQIHYEARSSLVGWTGLDLSVLSSNIRIDDDIVRRTRRRTGRDSSQSWLKLRKKMSSSIPHHPLTTTPLRRSIMERNFSGPPSESEGTCNSSSSDNFKSSNHTRHTYSPTEHTPGDSDLVDLIMTSPRGGGFEPFPHPSLLRSSLQTSTTMDSGVEDCCSETHNGHNHNLTGRSSSGPSSGSNHVFQMTKEGDGGFGFTVFWSSPSPPRIGRLVKGQAAERAGLRVGDLIVGVNGEDITSLTNENIYDKMKSTGDGLEIEIWREVSDGPGSSNGGCSSHDEGSSDTSSPLPPVVMAPPPPPSFQHPIRSLPPPVSILKPPPPLMATSHNQHPTTSSPPSKTAGSSWKIRFNVEFLAREDEVVKEFLICELKFFRKIVSALDRYLIPAQSKCLLSPSECYGIFSHVIKIITITKRILDCISQGGSSENWKLGEVMLRTHLDHLNEWLSGYKSYVLNLGTSATILADKMTFQLFAKFVLETPVPKGHLDMTSLLFAPLEHLRNLCEISDEIVHSTPEWTDLAQDLKECYADIVCVTDYMEPISHVSMKKQPILSVRHLEKRIVSTKFQDFKVFEKGRHWLFGSRLFRKESDGSFSPVWAFLFTDLLVLTSHHTTRDRVFFIRDAPVRLQDVVTLHFNIPKKHENEFRLLFGPELPQPQSRLDRLLMLKSKVKKPQQLVLRTPNTALKSIWKLLLQRQIITLNTRVCKSSSSNFSISEFCEKFPEPDAILDDEPIMTAPIVSLVPPTPQMSNVDKDYVISHPTPKQLPDASRYEQESQSPQTHGLSDNKNNESNLNLGENRTVIPITLATQVKINTKPDEYIPETSEPIGSETSAQVILEEEKDEIQDTPSNLRQKEKIFRRKPAHQDSPMIGNSDSRRRRILYDYKVRRDYPELFGITPRDRRSFIKSIGEKVLHPNSDSAQNSEVIESLVTPYYFISPAPSPLLPQRSGQIRVIPQARNRVFPIQQQRVPVPKPRSRVLIPSSKVITPQSLNLTRLNNLAEERGNDSDDLEKLPRSPEESSSNDSGISEDQLPLRTNSATLNGGLAMLNQKRTEVTTTTTSAYPRVLERTHTLQGKMEELVGIVEMEDKATETDDTVMFSMPRGIPLRLLTSQLRQSFFLNQPLSLVESAAQLAQLPPKSSPSDPLIVKILQGTTLHSSPIRLSESPSQNPKVTTESIHYTLLEGKKVARLERVESSDDSTSSDAASASPAGNENGTTDPSWSSTSSLTSRDDSAPPKPSSSSMIQPIQTHVAQKPQILITTESSVETQPSGRSESMDSTAENFGDEEEEDGFNFDDDEDELSHCSVATMNRYGTFESLEKLENDDMLVGIPEFGRILPRSKARFAFTDEEEEDVGVGLGDEDENLFEEDFESDFNFRFPMQIQDNTYSVSRLGPLPPLLEEDYEDELHEEGGSGNVKIDASNSSESSHAAQTGSASDSMTSTRFHQAGLRAENNFLLSRIATMYARSSISPLKLFRDLLLKKRYREWSATAYKD